MQTWKSLTLLLIAGITGSFALYCHDYGNAVQTVFYGLSSAWFFAGFVLSYYP